ncbi:gamma-butyrobetaine hydroxylase-like domain-containing protein [Methylobacterium phyllosphaerae]
MSEDLWPTEIRLSADRRVLNVAFEDGARYALPAEYLRVSSPSAEVQGHSPLERKVIGGKRSVAILAVQPIGNYAVKLGFDDMHDTGIYGWGYLHALGHEYETRWSTYLGELAERGLDRDTARQAAVKSGGGCGSGSCGCH